MTLTNAGSIASIVSLGLTIMVFFRVRALHCFYKRHLLLPNILRAISTHAKNAEKATTSKRNEDVLKALKLCDAQLERLLRHSDKPLKKRLRTTRKTLKELQTNPPNFLRLALYTVGDIEAVVESAKSFKELDRWKT
jgi:hypothetical protein